MKNILLTCESYYPRIGGAEIHLQKLQHHLRLDHQIKTSVITTESKRSTNPPKATIYCDYNNYQQIFSHLFSQAKRADLVHSHYCSRLASFAGFVAKAQRKPFVITLHGYGILDQPNFLPFSQKLHQLHRHLSLHLADHVISTSNELAGIASNIISQNKISIITNGTDYIPKINPLPHNHSIATFRRLVPKTGIQYLIQAMPALSKKIPKITLDIYGEGQLRKKLLQLAKDLSVTNLVRFHGPLAHDRVSQTMQKYQVIAFPSSAESTSLACLEAMMAGRVVVASKVGALTKMIGTKNQRGYLVKFLSHTHSTYDAPWIIAPQVSQKLAHTIYQALTSKQSTKLAQAARQYAIDHFTWEKIVDKTVKIYEKF